MAVTYTVIDSEGGRHQRTHRDHNAPVHRFAVVREPRNRDEIQFFGSEHLARSALVIARQRKWAAGSLRGKPMFPKAAVYPVTAKVEEGPIRDRL